MADQGHRAMMNPIGPNSQLIKLWQSRAPRERWLMALAAGLLVLLLLWFYSIRPALQLWKTAPAQRAQLTQNLSSIQQLAGQATALQKQARLDPAQGLEALKRSIEKMGGQATSEAGGRVVVQLKRAPTEELANWLQTVGPQTGARLVQASLREVETAHWAGRMTLELAQP